MIAATPRRPWIGPALLRHVKADEIEPLRRALGVVDRGGGGDQVALALAERRPLVGRPQFEVEGDGARPAHEALDRLRSGHAGAELETVRPADIDLIAGDGDRQIVGDRLEDEAMAAGERHELHHLARLHEGAGRTRAGDDDEVVTGQRVGKPVDRPRLGKVDGGDQPVALLGGTGEMHRPRRFENGIGEGDDPGRAVASGRRQALALEADAHRDAGSRPRGVDRGEDAGGLRLQAGEVHVFQRIEDQPERVATLEHGAGRLLGEGDEYADGATGTAGLDGDGAGGGRRGGPRDRIGRLDARRRGNRFRRGRRFGGRERWRRCRGHVGLCGGQDRCGGQYRRRGRGDGRRRHGRGAAGARRRRGRHGRCRHRRPDGQRRGGHAARQVGDGGRHDARLRTRRRHRRRALLAAAHRQVEDIGALLAEGPDVGLRRDRHAEHEFLGTGVGLDLRHEGGQGVTDVLQLGGEGLGDPDRQPVGRPVDGDRHRLWQREDEAREGRMIADPDRHGWHRAGDALRLGRARAPFGLAGPPRQLFHHLDRQAGRRAAPGVGQHVDEEALARLHRIDRDALRQREA
jgi:hypothetical protein